MKIAIPSMDGQTLSAHFGRSRYFLVLDLEGGVIRSHELRANNQAHGAPSNNQEHHVCGSHDEPEQGHTHAHGHDHAGFAALLSDCAAVICGGMGGGARTALEAAGLRVCLVDATMPPEEAAKAYERGILQEREGAGCGHHGMH